MSRVARRRKQLRAQGEIRVLARHAILTGVTTIIALAFRYILLYFRGSYELALFGRSFNVEINDAFAYNVYYISSLILLYLCKWFTSDGVKGGSFIPRLLAFIGVNGVGLAVGNVLLALLINHGMHGELAFWIVSVITFFINYLGNRLFVFADADNRTVRRHRRRRRTERSRPNG